MIPRLPPSALAIWARTIASTVSTVGRGFSSTVSTESGSVIGISW